MFEAMRTGHYNSWDFPPLGWEHIPALLERSVSRTQLKSFPVNPISSCHQPSCEEGVAAVWLIEGIRRGGRYPSLNPRLIANRAGDQEGQRQQLIEAYWRWWQKARDSATRSRAPGPLDDSSLAWY